MWLALTEVARASQSVSGTVRRGPLEEVVGVGTGDVARAAREAAVADCPLDDLRGGMAVGGEEGKEAEEAWLFVWSAAGLSVSFEDGEGSLGSTIVKGTFLPKAARQGGKVRGLLWEGTATAGETAALVAPGLDRGPASASASASGGGGGGAKADAATG